MDNIVDLRRLALRCPDCHALFEVPSVEAQEEGIRDTYAGIVDRLRFPCPNCGRYLSCTGPIRVNDLERF